MFYDGSGVLSMMDINGNVPEIYIVTSNRSAGKTTYFNRYVLNKFIKNSEQFLLLYRYNYELDNVANKFFGDIHTLFFKDYEMDYKLHSKGLYATLYLTGGILKHAACGYAVAINQANNIKKLSHIFSEVKTILFDEFQAEYARYCPNEIDKFISIHTSVARGQGSQSRYVKVIMLSNTISTINPYFLALGISKRLKKDTKFLRGDGFVLEQSFNADASKAQKSSTFNKAFSAGYEKYLAYNAEGIYLDNDAFVQKPSGHGKYLATIYVDNRGYSIKAFPGYLYCDASIDKTHPVKYAANSDSHTEGTIIALPSSNFVTLLRDYYVQGKMRFKDIECKNAVLEFLRHKIII